MTVSSMGGMSAEIVGLRRSEDGEQRYGIDWSEQQAHGSGHFGMTMTDVNIVCKCKERILSNPQFAMEVLRRKR